MKKITLVICIAAFLLGCSVVEVDDAQHPYFPIAEGYSWTYEVRSMGRIDTVTSRMVEVDINAYSWITDVENQDKMDYDMSILSSDGSESGEPFDSSTIVVVDSALETNWIRLGKNRIGIEPVQTYLVKTPAGDFDNCLLIKDRSDTEGFDIWFAPDIGPVQARHWKEDVLHKEFRLIEYNQPIL